MNIFLFGLVVARFWDYVVNSELYDDDPRTTKVRSWITHGLSLASLILFFVKGVLLSVMALCTASVGVSVGQVRREIGAVGRAMLTLLLQAYHYGTSQVRNVR